MSQPWFRKVQAKRKHKPYRAKLLRLILGGKVSYGMLRLFVCLLRNEDGFTAVECGILGCLTVIFAEKFIAPF